MPAYLPDHDSRTTGNALGVMLALLLGLTFVTGGGSQDHGPADALMKLLAVPVLGMALLAWCRQPIDGLRLATGVVALLVVAIPVLQLLPLPAGLWQWPPARVALMQDLQAAGVEPSGRWTLTPFATERAAWSQLPALAVFFGALVSAERTHRTLMYLVVWLVLGSLLLGMVQLGLPRDSALNPFPQWAPKLGGVFANPNHQATALTLGLVLALGLWLDRRNQPMARDRPQWQPWVLSACAVLFLVALPLTGSRAGLLVATPALLAILLTMRVFNDNLISKSRLARTGLLCALGLVAFLGYVALRWVQVDAADEHRLATASATFALGRDLMPLGAGVGSFVPWFEQAGPGSLLMYEYINHAHNEYAQWWLEGGVLAVLALIAVFVVLAQVLRVLLRHRASGGLGIAAWFGAAVLLAWSLVDYPLRTPALMTVGALLAGIAIAHATKPASLPVDRNPTQ